MNELEKLRARESLEFIAFSLLLQLMSEDAKIQR